MKRGSQFIVLMILMTAWGWAQQGTLVDIREMYPEEMEVAGFKLDSRGEVSLSGSVFALDSRRSDVRMSDVWILNSETRDVVWELDDASLEEKDEYLREYEATLSLDPGTYEVYYSTYPLYGSGDTNYYFRSGGGFFSRLFGAFSDHDDDDYRSMRKMRRHYREVYKDLFLTIKGSGQALSEDEIYKVQESIRSSSFISFTPLRDEDYHRQRFSVTSPVEVEVYAIGEARRDGEFDFSRLQNVNTRKTIWRMDYRDSDKAGGARKNRLVRETITLPAGEYVLISGTDDSHSYKHWNSAPPRDPSFWGVTLFLKNKGDAARISRVDDQSLLPGKTFVNFDKVRDREFKSKGFTLKQDADICVYALGEGSDGDMYDYGWIVDMKDHKKVWKMKYRETEPAGGASKNRVFDDLIHLDAGNYVAYYITDDSHAWRDWNAAEPFDNENWGMKLSVVGNNGEAIVADYSPEADKSVIAQLVRVGDYEKERVRFTLDKRADIRIYALGEGSNGDMYDYGWIRDAETDEIIWKMRYRDTDNAGGARKNRMIDEVITLDAGEYYLYFKTDDSHSFEDWNAEPPYDPENWGITVYSVK